MLNVIVEPEPREREEGGLMTNEEMKAEDDVQLRKIHTRYVASGGRGVFSRLPLCQAPEVQEGGAVAEAQRLALPFDELCPYLNGENLELSMPP